MNSPNEEHAEQLTQLYAALGDHKARNRQDGIFEARLGGPGSVPELADLPAEWQFDLLPFPPTPAQVEALLELGYVQTETREDRLMYRRSDGLNVVLLSHDHGFSFEQKLLWAHLKESVEACRDYRVIYLHESREAADAILCPERKQSMWHAPDSGHWNRSPRCSGRRKRPGCSRQAGRSICTDTRVWVLGRCARTKTLTS